MEIVQGGTLICDSGRILEVLRDLISNAVRFSQEGGAVSVRAGIEQGGAWFSVQDDGPGIPEDQLPYLFERLVVPRKIQQPGGGLALAVAKGIVRLHGGRLWVETKVGEGSTFHFTIQVAGA